MKVRFCDIYTGEVYSLVVSGEKLVLSKISTREAAEKFYVLVDQLTGITYILQVAQGKLQLVRPSKLVFGMTLCGVPDAEGTRVYVIELLGGRLCYREASAEEVSKMTSDESSIFMNRRLQDYLPLFIQEYEEIQTIMNAQEQARILPICLALGIFRKTTIATPKKAKRGAIMPTSSAISCPVIVVPIFAPMIIQTACCNFIIPELTKPTTITVVAEDD